MRYAAPCDHKQGLPLWGWAVNLRQRVEKTITFQEPDRVPIDLGGMKASGIAVSAYDRLKNIWDVRAK